MPPRTYIVGGSPLKRSTTVSSLPPTSLSPRKTRRAAATTATTRTSALLSSSPGRPGAIDDDSDDDFHTSPTVATKKPKRGRKPKDLTTATPTRKRTMKTPKTPTQGAPTPRMRAAADQSARRKSMRTMIERANNDELDSDDERLGLARQIYGSSSEDRSKSDEDELLDEKEFPSNESGVPTTPSRKRNRKSATTEGGTAPKKCSRPKREISIEPPKDLPPHEMYFWHNKPGRAQTSNATLSDLEMLTADEYFTLARDLADTHAGDVAFLQALHEESFPQWVFELSEGFSLCLFGMGSKRTVVRRFATFLAKQVPTVVTAGPNAKNQIIMVNGFARAITARDLLTTIWASLDMLQRPQSVQPAALLADILRTLSSRSETITIIVNSVDAPPMRKPGMQAILASLAASAHIRLVVSADSPDFSILWDAGQRNMFNFAFHDATTLAPFSLPEIDPVEDVHDLLGRTNRRVGGKEGVTFVLKSLTQNAKGLYLLLLAEVLAAMDDGNGPATENPGIEYRVLFNKAVEAFVCPSSEMAFRQLLKEFHDHQMITSTRDALGTELISTPFRKEEMEQILEDIA